MIQNTTVYYGEEYFRYEDICAKWMSECFKNDILNLDYVLDDVSIVWRSAFDLINYNQLLLSINIT